MLDVFDIDDDPEFKKLAQEAKDIDVPTYYVQAPNFQRIPKQAAPVQQQDGLPSDDDIERMLGAIDAVPLPEPPKPKETAVPPRQEPIIPAKVPVCRRSRPWLLSTHKTLVEHGRIYYEGKEFSFDTQKRKRRKLGTIEAEWKNIFYNVIVPNGIVARECGARVDPKEAIVALDYAMTVKRTPGDIVDWKQCRDRLDLVKLMRRFNFYANGIGLSKNGHSYYMPESRTFSHMDYVQKKIKNLADEMPDFSYSGNPRLRELIGIFDGNRSIGSLKTREVRDRFGVSLDTANAFKQWIRERREAGRPDNEFTISY